MSKKITNWEREMLHGPLSLSFFAPGWWGRMPKKIYSYPSSSTSISHWLCIPRIHKFTNTVKLYNTKHLEVFLSLSFSPPPGGVGFDPVGTYPWNDWAAGRKVDLSRNVNWNWRSIHQSERIWTTKTWKITMVITNCPLKESVGWKVLPYKRRCLSFQKLISSHILTSAITSWVMNHPKLCLKFKLYGRSWTLTNQAIKTNRYELTVNITPIKNKKCSRVSQLLKLCLSGKKNMRAHELDRRWHNAEDTCPEH